jgi:hypothetical protein
VTDRRRWFSGGLGGEEVKPGFTQSVSVFMIKIMGIFHYLDGFQMMRSAEATIQAPAAKTQGLKRFRVRFSAGTQLSLQSFFCSFPRLLQVNTGVVP